MGHLVDYNFHMLFPAEFREFLKAEVTARDILLRY